MSGIWVVAEERDGRISRASWEAMAAGAKLAQLTGLAMNAAVIGAKAASMANEIAARTPGKVARLEHALLAAYTADGFTLTFAQFFQAEQPNYVVFPHTYQVRDFAPALAARMGQALIGDVTAIGEGPVFTRQLMQGRLNGAYRHAGSGPCFISVQSGAFRADSVVACERAAEIFLFTPAIEPTQIRTRPGERFRGTAQTVDLGSAQRIVSVGRGIKDPANLPLIKDLAAALDAELGASRPVCDAGWLPPDRQVGSSGQTVAPKLYLAIGISGAIQHQVGMKGSQCVAAINKDPDAPIFEIADYGIAGDLFDVVPALTEAIKAAKQ